MLFNIVIAFGVHYKVNHVRESQMILHMSNEEISLEFQKNNSKHGSSNLGSPNNSGLSTDVIPSDANPLSRTSSGIDKKFLQLFVLISIISQSKVSWQKHINTVTTARFQWGFT